MNFLHQIGRPKDCCIRYDILKKSLGQNLSCTSNLELYYFRTQLKSADKQIVYFLHSVYRAYKLGKQH